VRRVPPLMVLVGIGALPATAHAAFPGTNGAIAVESGLRTTPAIASMAPDGSGYREVFPLGGPERRDPSWSPDGRRLAFTRIADGDEDVYVLQPNGTERAVAVGPSSDTDPAFSPNGDELAFTSSRDGNREIYVVAVDGGAPRRLTASPGPDQQPAWSIRDEIAFSSARDGGDLDVWVMGADGADPRPVTANDRTDADPSWSPDGHSLAFTTGTPGSFDIFVVPAEGGTASRLSLPGSSHFPAWSPDGAKIAFAADGFGIDSIFTTGAPGSRADDAGPAHVPVPAEFTRTQPTDPNWQPLPKPADATTPPPDASTIVVAEPGGGVKVAAHPDAVPVSPLRGAAVLPAAATIAAPLNGPALIVAASTTAKGGAITAAIRNGRFSLTRRSAAGPLRIKARLGTPSCPRRRRAAAARIPRRGPLLGRSRGPVAAAGNHGRASIESTAWSITELCAGTRYRVREGAFTVFDEQGQAHRLTRSNPTFLVPKPSLVRGAA
jgi:hypothetical protein